MQGLDIVELLTRPGTYVLAVVIYIATFFVRRVTESLVPSLKKRADANAPGVTYLTQMSRWWNEVILYALPVLFGMASGFSKSEFFYDGIDGVSARVLFGAAVGWFSSMLYKILRKVIRQKLGVEVPGSSVAPPSGG